MSALAFGPLDKRTLHLCVDMQRLFLEPGPWHCPAGLDLLPAIEALIDHAPERTVFTRFITPAHPEDAPGSWRRYYGHWHAVTQDEAGAEIMALHPALAARAAPERVFDKRTHDAFTEPAFARRLAGWAPSALVLSGVETDVCVLTTALSAVDHGYRTVIAVDAVASSVPASHAACLAHVYPRFDQQIELAATEDILAAWSPA